ncbi:MAG: AMP-binding protein [Myxococcales bacterium]|nr:AMP-binding protein [Myxococcales bacterium]
MLTLSCALARTVRLFGEKPAVLGPAVHLSWRQAGERVARAASALHMLGVRTGRRFGILAPNDFRVAELLHAGYRLGAVPVPINTRLAPPEVAFILEDADCQLVLVAPACAATLDHDAMEPWRDRTIALDPFGASRGPSACYEELLAAAGVAPSHEAQEDDDALLVYTSGTTGRPKGVRLSHRNILVNALQVSFEHGAATSDVYLHVAPMFHSADLLSTPYLLAGATHVFLPRFSTGALFDVIEAYRVTSTLLTPTMIVRMLQAPDFARRDLSSLRQLFYGSSPMSVPWIGRMLDALPAVQCTQGYGLTETSPILTMLSSAEQREARMTGDERLASVGRAAVGVELSIIDEQGHPLESGQVGELQVRAPNVSRGYLNRARDNTEAFQAGWFRTGDVGRLDERGYLYLLDRKKDRIITGGEIVHSLEVEAVLHQHPSVQECAVVGIPDEIYGEALLAAVVPVTGREVDPQALIEHCRGRIGGYKIPRRYVFLDALPRSALNKVLKHELRRVYSGSADSG